jgi:hypothetical protein
MEAKIRATPIDLSSQIPSIAKAVRLRYETVPPDSSLLIYASPDSEPVRVSGTGRITVTLKGQTIYIYRTNDLRDCKVNVEGYDI